MSKYNLSIEPNDDNIKKAIINDALKNNQWICDFLTLLLDIDESIVALSGNWGSGKTFIAKEMQEIINVKFENQFGRDIDSYINKNTIFKNVSATSCYSIYYNAWEYDNDNNPMASFLYYLVKMLNKKISSVRFIQVLESFITNVIEKLSDGWIKISKSNGKSNLNDVLSSVLTIDYIYDEIGKLLQELRSERCNKLIIFIDELDRCRPTYALKVIEMLNHYFRRDGILVVCMIDFQQLSNVIKLNYGTKTNANLYLDKIFDFRFSIPEVNNIETYLYYKIGSEYDEKYFFDAICAEIIKEKKLTLRNIDRMISYIKPLFKKYKNDADWDFPVRGLLLYFWAPYFLSASLFDNDEIDRLFAYNFDNVISFAQRKVVSERINQVYSMALEDKDETKDVIYCLKADLKIIINHMKDKEARLENMYIGKPYSDVKKAVEELNLLSMFNERIRYEKNGK